MKNDKIEINNIEITNDANNLTDKEQKSLNGKWYIIIAYNGHEDRVKNAIEQMRLSLKMEDHILDLQIVKDIEINAKTKKQTAKNIFPGYIFLKAIMTDQVWYKIRNTKGVTGFVGANGKGAKPTPLKNHEALRMMKKIDFNTNKTPEYVPTFAVGDLVTVTQGERKDYSGIVKKLDNIRGYASVDIELFGRLIPTEIEYSFLIKK